MLQENCRIEKFKGFRFYEKDILYDDYIFTNDIKIEIDVTYVAPGFGIAVMDNDGYSIKEKNDIYLFKIGYKEASIYYSNSIENELVKQITFTEAKTIQEHMKYTFIKKDKKVIVYMNDKKVFEEYIKRDLSKYSIGYYSNAGNIINNISIAANIPENWTINMSNTQGGYIRFLNDTFEITDCKNNAEIEQSNIHLKANTYYLDFTIEDIDEDTKNDIKYYVHKSNDDRLFDEEKNILRPGDKFTLLEDTDINLKFTGTSGRIKNISFSRFENDDYISTTIDRVDFLGSYIDVFLSEIKKVTWKGMITRVPEHILFDNDVKYGLIMDNKTIVKPEDTPIRIGKDENTHIYDYEFNTEDYYFKIRKNNEVIYIKRLIDISNKITIFKNLSAIITEFILYKKNGDVININVQDENKRYVNASISSPIIVVDDYGAPLNLSSSYRKCIYKDYERYVFTNWEREYFEVNKIINLSEKMLNQDDVIKIFGIKKDYEFNLDNIYNVREDNINSIDLMTQHYDVLRGNDILYVDRLKSTITLNENILNKYQMIIIDYLKADNYCINYHYDKHVYEVNISSTNKNNKLLYDSNLINDKDKKIYQVSDYKTTNINGNINGYVVLKKGGL